MAKHKNWMWLWWISFILMIAGIFILTLNSIWRFNIWYFILNTIFPSSYSISLWNMLTRTSLSIFGLATIIQIYYAIKRIFSRKQNRKKRKEWLWWTTFIILAITVLSASGTAFHSLVKYLPTYLIRVNFGTFGVNILYILASISAIIQVYYAFKN